MDRKRRYELVDVDGCTHSTEPPTAEVMNLYCCATSTELRNHLRLFATAEIGRHGVLTTRRYACVEAEVKCLIAYHDGKNQDNLSDGPNISSTIMRTQQGLQGTLLR